MPTTNHPSPIGYSRIPFAPGTTYHNGHSQSILETIDPRDVFINPTISDQTNPAFLKPDPQQLVKEMDLDISDLLLHLIKGQPRVSSLNLYGFNNHSVGSRYFERDNASFDGQFSIFFNSSTIAQLTCRPHKKLVLTGGLSTPKAQFAQGILLKVMLELFPATRVKRLPYDQ